MNKKFENVKLHVAYTDITAPDYIQSNENMSKSLAKLKNSQLRQMILFTDASAATATTRALTLDTNYASLSTEIFTTVGSTSTFNTGALFAIKVTNGIKTSSAVTISYTKADSTVATASLKYHGGATLPEVKAGTVISAIFDGTNFNIIGDIDTSGGLTASDGIKIDSGVIKHNVTTSADTTSTASAISFTAVDAVTRDSYGHVTTLNTKTVTVPTATAGASGTLGVVKSSSTVTSTSGLTACPIISGIVYYKDTNTDTKVNIQTTTAKNYIMGTITTPTTTDTGVTAVGRTDVYVDESGHLFEADGQVATKADLEALPEPMVFKGTIGKSGGSGTTATVPTNPSEGDTYKIIEENKNIAAASSATGSAFTAKIGDTIIATKVDTAVKWTLIPSGDEPSGTVTSVGLTTGTDTTLTVSNSPIKSSGNLGIAHTNSVTAVTTTGLLKVAYDTAGHITSSAAVVKKDITDLGIPGSDTDTKVNYVATTSKAYLIGTTSAPTATATGVTGAGRTTVFIDANGHLNEADGQVAVKSDITGITGKSVDGVLLSSGTDIIHYATCATAAATAAKTATVTGFKLVTGARLFIKWTYTNTATSPTLTINDGSADLAAKSITYSGSNAASIAGLLIANKITELVYDGTNFEIVNDTRDYVPYQGLTGGTSSAFTLAAPGFVLYTGARITVKMSTNSAANATLNVNSTGAKTIRYNNANMAVNTLRINRYYDMIYDGTYWQVISDIDTNTTYNNESLGTGYCVDSRTSATATITSTPTNQIYLVRGGIVSVKLNYDVPASASMNISGKGAKPIYVDGAAITAGVLEAGDTATFIYDGTNYNLISVDHPILGDTLELWCIDDPDTTSTT